MRHYQDLSGIPRSSTISLMEQVFSILDSKIQFIDFQVQQYFQTCTSETMTGKGAEYSESNSSLSNQLVNNFNQIMSFTEELQYDLKLLQILKVWLKEETVQDTLDLLTNNKYLSFTEDKLEHLLKQKALFHYQLKMDC